MSNWNEILLAKKGSVVVNDATEYVATIYRIICLEDTIFASIKVAGVDAKSSYITTPATAVKAGAIITPLDCNKPFSAVDLTSGSVNVTLG
jgi:hypothetical protein